VSRVGIIQALRRGNLDLVVLVRVRIDDGPYFLVAPDAGFFNARQIDALYGEIRDAKELMDDVPVEMHLGPATTGSRDVGDQYPIERRRCGLSHRRDASSGWRRRRSRARYAHDRTHYVECRAVERLLVDCPYVDGVPAQEVVKRG